MKVSERFMQHNADSPIVAAEWLMADKKPAKGPPKNWKWFRVTLEDGTVYDIPEAEQADIVKSGFVARWKGIA